MDFSIDNRRLSNLITLHPLRMTKQLEQYKEEDSCWKTTIPVVNKNYIFGLELETENVQNSYYTEFLNNHRSYWRTEPDASLRNDGVEFVSIPLKAFQIEYALDQLQACYKTKYLKWTARTSTHVHVNIRDLTLNQILNFILIYCAVERLLFNWVGNERKNNIFCIPLYKTWYYKYIHLFTSNPLLSCKYWNKYTALNIKPLVRYGTVEFRHLYGTWDKKTILTCTNLISCIKNYAKNNPTTHIKNQIFNLNSVSNYDEFIYDVFKEYAKILLETTTNLQNEMEDTVSFCKLCLAHSDNIFN